MKTVVVAALLVAAASGASAARPRWHELEGYTFERYQADFHKVYTAGEVAERRATFEARLKEVRTHNAEPGHTWRKGINHLSDRSEAELRQMRGRRPTHTEAQLNAAPKFTGVKGLKAPKTLDYTKNYPPVLTAVKDQGQCGSCWAHAATETIETAQALKNGQLYVLSQQQLTSCVQNPNQCGGTGGCAGATAELGIEYASQAGLTEEWMYSYQSYFGNVPACSFNATATPAFVKPTGYTVSSPRNDADVVIQSLLVNGPLAISVDASHWSTYESGIFRGCDYAKNITMDHAVQLVGYGYDEQLKSEYWKVRNSWSASFGELGYIRVYKESGAPECGWDNEWVTGGGGCKGESNNVWSCGQCGILYDTLYANI